MHIEINAKTLAVAASAAAKVATTAPSAAADIYRHILLEADASGLTVTAVNNRMSLRRRVEVDHVHAPGSVCLPAATLAQLTARIPTAASVSLEYPDDAPAAILSFGRARHAVPMMPGDEFPAIASEIYTSEIRADAIDFAEALRRTAPFSEREDGHNYRLAGVHLRPGGSGLELIAATSRHATRSFVAADGDVTPVTVPVTTVPIVASLVGDAIGSVLIKTSATKVGMMCDGMEIICSIVDGDYPPIDAAEDRLAFRTSFDADPAEIRAAMERLKILASADEKLNSVRYLHLTARGDTLYLYSSSECVEEIGITPVDEEASMCLASDDFSLILATVPHEPLARFTIDGETKGGAIKVEDPQHPELGRAFSLGMLIQRPMIAFRP